MEHLNFKGNLRNVVQYSKFSYCIKNHFVLLMLQSYLDNPSKRVKIQVKEWSNIRQEFLFIKQIKSYSVEHSPTC